jgi:hypothetical protein
VFILHGFFDTREALGNKSIEKSVSLFGGNIGISLNTTSNSRKIGKYSRPGPMFFYGSST